MIKFLIYKYQSHQENKSTYSLLSGNKADQIPLIPTCSAPEQVPHDHNNLIDNVSVRHIFLINTQIIPKTNISVKFD